MKSTLENPLAFFEYIIDENNIKIEIEKQNYYYGFESYKNTPPKEIEFIEKNEWGVYETWTIEVKNILLPQLKNEVENSTKFMLATFLRNDPNLNYLKFLQYQFNSIQSLIFNRVNIINRYPFLLLPLRELIQFINDRLLLPGMDKFILNENEIQYTTLLNQEPLVLRSNNDVISSVLGYMNGKNEKQEKILSPENFLLLIEYTTHLIEKEELPQIHTQLKPNLSNDVIRFSFWVLHKELYTTTKIRSYFYEFIQLVFEKFKDNDIKSIKSQFGTKSRVKRDDFLPETIKKYLVKH